MSRRELRRLRDALQAEGAPRPFSGPVVERAPAPEPEPTAATILTICTGNICRSPMAEVLLRAQLTGLPVRVHSAGTHALVDHEMTEQGRELAVRHGAQLTDAAAHRARLLTPVILDESDLILAMSREHRSLAVQATPAALHRTFTVREFARLAATLSDDDVRRGVEAAGDDPSARLRALARLVGGQRGLVPAPPDEDDVTDPYRRSQATYDLSGEQLGPAAAEAGRAIRVALA